ncbi:MAG: DUF4355 domain-containing protein [Clostridium septicum]|uniref:DUF4355 domain-containing protein n=1 Tax=Clostridium septicum TaxID=1504 RepID=UPI002584E36B|nr:DUF4355 domain-containing protein [Clostridium septicum]MDU1315209.1 DUF4355 domain-containing protein [Clostridium septicum]
MDVENNIEISEKLDNEVVNATNEVTLNQFKETLDNNIDCKGYFDSLVDKTVNTRLDKSIDSWKSKNLENIINEEINKRYPQKTEVEIKFEEQQKALEKAQEEKRQLELQIKYQDLMAENNLPMDILDFVADKDIETTITNIGRFKELTQKYVDDGVKNEVNRRFKECAYTPPGDQVFSSHSGSMWNR